MSAKPKTKLTYQAWMIGPSGWVPAGPVRDTEGEALDDGTAQLVSGTATEFSVRQRYTLDA